ncbi:HAMP domain-containing protein [Carbonactinospora thermoautotrophica]|nr:HAMP domain-containing protein [Carbonactinospora thermoautotrophica]
MRTERTASGGGAVEHPRETAALKRLLAALEAVRDGNFRKRLAVTGDGLYAEIAMVFNEMVERNQHLANELARVRRLVGRDGRLTERLNPGPCEGAWGAMIENANALVDDLVRPTAEVGRVLGAVAQGDLSQKMELRIDDRPLRGEFLRMGRTVNGMVDQLSLFTSEVTRVAREVGTEGKLGGQAIVPGVAGVWKDLTDSVNTMASRLTNQVRDIAQVTTAVARGDLSKKVTVEVAGEMLELKNTVNTMVDQLSGFADEVTRVAREVGTEGRLGGQARVRGVAGTWKDLTDSVNSMASNLTAQVRDIAQVTTAVARGDLSKKVTVDVKGELLELKNTVNTMVDQLSGFADEVTRVAREVGTEGRLGGQAQVPGVAGTWKDLTDSVNFMASNLTAQVRDIAQVTTAVARGDLSKKVTVDVKGELLELKNTINTMVDQLSAFASEVTRVAREVGSEGRLGGQAQVPGVAGTWKDLTDNVNFMANNLTSQVRNIAQVTTAVAQGDLSKKITVDARGEILQLKNTINTMVDQLSAFADEVTRVAREVGTEGRLGGQAQVSGVSGTWRDLTDSVNSMASNLTSQVRSIAQVTTAVAQGDLSKKITVEARGEILELKNTINTMVEQLRAFADEVTRVAREVGTEGRLGGQAQVSGVSGTWRDLTDSVNSMANNLTSQVRSIAQVTTAVARGDLSKKIDVDARGEILELKNTINTMVDQLSAFASEVTRVAREVGTEGRLGGHAEVEGVSGTWQRLTESVNQLASSLTTQVRAIAEVATAVARGDLSRQITVEAKGELSELRDNINQMIANLRETTRANQEQDWLKTNLARISALMQGRRDLEDVAKLIMSEITPVVSAQYGAFFLAQRDEDGKPQPVLDLLASYGFQAPDGHRRFAFGEGLVGQAAVEKQPILVTDLPQDYLKIVSGLGEAPPASIIVLPVLFENQVLGVIELASFHEFSEIHRAFLDQLMENVGVTVNTIIANSRTEALLAESQRLAEELKAQKEELRRSNVELEQQAASLKASEELLQRQQEELQLSNQQLEEKAALLADQNRAIEIKNSEIEQARRALEERAEQLALSSKYKSEFLANMSHELRTPLNSLLILAKLLADNPDRNLTAKQVEFAQTIYNAGSDLLQLINDILDLSKVEAGKMDIHPGDLPVTQLVEYVEATFRPLTIDKGLRLTVEVGPEVPPTLYTDEQRLQQILRNLLSNAVKFTETGEVKLHIYRPQGVNFVEEKLRTASDVVAFEVVDTGIGIPADKLKVIFEAFQQADGTTSRKYGGTGLGLSISREIARLLGGEIHAESELGKGSVFTLYLPARIGTQPADRRDRRDGTADQVRSGSRRAPKPRRAPEASPVPVAADPPEQLVTEPDISDDRGAIQPGDRVLLVVGLVEEHVQTGVEIGHEHGFKVVGALGAEAGFAAARNLAPDAVLLAGDVAGPDGVLLLDLLKRTPDTRHVPVAVVDRTGREEQRLRALRAGALTVVADGDREQISKAVGELAGFLDRPGRRLLIIQSDDSPMPVLSEVIGAGDDVEITRVETIGEAVDVLVEKRFDCLVVDALLPGQRVGPLLEAVAQLDSLRDMPVLVHVEGRLSREDETRLGKLLEPMVARTTRSAEQLRDAVTLFLHRSVQHLPSSRWQPTERSAQAVDSSLAGVKVLIVDDDVRNVFALTSVLERHGIEVLYAENGREGIDMLQRHDDVQLVLMDVMMPEMDGYATMEAIRKMPQFSRLPIIALTAKAMKGDREKSIAAGASDYVTKPVDIDQLLSVMRSWLQR